MWQELLTALSLFLLIEGMIPFISPSKYRNFVERMSQLEDTNLRFIGLISMLIGLLLLFFIKA
jgi:uncharacterized protein YjeT (DUF2065 family)